MEIQDTNQTEKPKRQRKVQIPLNIAYHDEPSSIIEVGIDEAGRGPMFGAVYAAAVVLPKVGFDHHNMKDSKKFSSKKKLYNTADYIKEHCIAYSVQYEDEKTIDKINIRQATLKCMHRCIQDIMKQLHEKRENNDMFLLVDGNDFKPYYTLIGDEIETIPHICIEGGDNKYTSIAAASILAKTFRDKYIENLCESHPDLQDKYSILTNKGYGAAKHLDGIRSHGITQWHRKTFGICRNHIDL